MSSGRPITRRDFETYMERTVKREFTSLNKRLDSIERQLRRLEKRQVQGSSRLPHHTDGTPDPSTQGCYSPAHTDLVNLTCRMRVPAPTGQVFTSGRQLSDMCPCSSKTS